ncbi:MAG TPA: TrbG/VirB9 family P-type conjugative transfer protein [Candidatus Cybelea sp.]|nr:TrbG/VirB9 family P-type conjugative transfer protein [Candidatus Cybelea sp.]
MKVSTLHAFSAVALAIASSAVIGGSPAFAQQNGATESGTQWNPEELPVQTVFDYGAKDEPTLVCAPKQYCAIALETGETLQAAQADDNHWSITPTTYGAGDFAKPVILISPREAGYSDELTITSVSAKQQPRSYKIKLVSDAKQYTHLAAYRYPMAQ